MNIFFIELDPCEIAKSQGDKHCVKMCLETAQMLSTVYQQRHPLITTDLYKPTHKNHPMTKWVGESQSNWLYTLKLLQELLLEYEYRYGKIHASGKIYTTLSFLPLVYLPKKKPTIPPLCMPDEYKVGGVIDSYRAYYRSKHKQGIVEYNKNRSEPSWLK